MTTDLLSQLHDTTVDLVKTVSMFTQEQFNTVPFEGSWTPAQVAEHIYKSEANLVKLLTGNTQPTERQPDEKAAQIRQIFLDMSHKMKSPEFILPSPADVIQDKEERIALLQANRDAIEKTAANMDITVTLMDFALPNMGNLTALEWIVFITTHSARHIQQLKNMYREH